MLRNLVLAGRCVLRRSDARASPAMFIDEFQPMLAMYMNSTSIGYGSPRAALVITMCIRPCADERRVPANTPCRCAAACRRHRPADPPGPCGKPSGAPLQRLARLHVAGLAGAASAGGVGCGIRRLVAEAAGAIDRAQQDLQQMQHRGRSGSRWRAPRCRAWRASPPAGRPSCRGGGRAVSVHGMSSVICCSKAACASSAAMRRMVSAATAGRLRDRARAYSSAEKALGDQLESRHAPCGHRAA